MTPFALLLLSAWIAAPGAAAPAPRSAAETVPGPVPVAATLPDIPEVQGLRGDYYNGIHFNERVLSRVDKRINFHWRAGDLPGPGVDQQAFSARWTGKLYTPAEGTYNLIVHTDNGIRVWVGGNLLISNWRVQTLTTFKKEIKLKAGGHHDLKIEYFNYMGPAILRLAWESPLAGTASSGLPHYTAEATIPENRLFTQPPPPSTAAVTPAARTAVLQDEGHRGGNGLLGEYYRGDAFGEKVFTRIDKKIDFVWHGSPGPDLSEVDFSVRWTGKLLAPADGMYKFSVHINDGARLWIGGKLVLDEWRLEPGKHYVTETHLEAGRLYDIRLEYFNGPQLGIMQLSWESPENRISLFGLELYSSAEIVPTQYLFSAPLPDKPKPAVARVNPPPARKSTPVAAGAPVAQTQSRPRAKTPPANPGPAPESSPAATAGNKTEETFEDVEAGKPVVLRQILFERSKYVLLPQSYAELDKLANTLLKYPDWRIEIAGHTDNVGDPALNQALSENRAIVVANYLVRQGVADDRITAKGYGSSRPVAGNATETERSRNRRVEFVVEQE